MQIAKNKVVAIDYTLTDTDGTVIDSSQGKEPLKYLHGAGQIVPGLETALEGQTLGDQLSVVVEPADGYGEVQEGLRSSVDRSHFGEVEDLELGMRFRVPASQGENLVVTVVEISGDSVTVDGNHPLAGVTLNFNVSVRDVRDATEDEIGEGQVDN